MTIAKICGITNLGDAQYAAEAGADMLGFILYPKSPRYVAPERICDIVTHVRMMGSVGSKVITVGVFVNTPPDRILQTLAETGLELAQLSGDESDEQVQMLGARAYKAVRSLKRADAVLAQRLATNAETSATAPDLLLDADHPTLYGGSGTLADETTAATLARKCRLLLAGGLTPANVGGVIRLAHPWGVDVASGVEASPGKKDTAKVLAFLQAVRDADGGC